MRKLTILLVLFYCSVARAGTTVIGNSGQPQTTNGHVPFLIPAVALDAAGNPYTVHDWDEPGYKIDRWNPLSGEVAWHSTGIINDLLDSIAVEPDGSYAYVGGWNQTAPSMTLDIWKANLTTGATVVFGSGSQTIKAATGSTTSQLPIALSGQYLWVTARDSNLVEQYDKVAGTLVSSFSVTTPFGIAVDSSGNIWVGSNKTTVQVYSPAGVLLATPITGLTQVQALALTGTTLYVGDQGASNIKQYTLSGTTATYVQTIGHPAQPGQNSPSAIWQLEGLAADSLGDLVYCEYTNGGSLLHTCYSTSAEHVWSAMCTEFQSCIAWSPTTQFLIGGYRNAYDTTGTQQRYWCGSARTENGPYYFGNIFNATGGTCKVVTLGGNDFYYFFGGGGDNSTSLAVYRVVPASSGVALQFASTLSDTISPSGAASLANQYLWSWDDTTGPGLTSVNSSTVLGGPDLIVNANAKTGNPFGCIVASMNVDANGTIWLAEVAQDLRNYGGQLTYQSVWAVPLHGLNSAGNPIYHWADAVQVVNNTVLCTAVGVAPGNNTCGIVSANYSAVDGLLYVVATNPSGVKPPWMGGNVLIAFPVTGLNPATAASWTLPGTNYYVGMCPVPLSTGGVIVGQNTGGPYSKSGVVVRYSKTGSVVASYFPPSQFGDGTNGNNPEGAFDIYGPINASLNPNGSLDIFAEDDYNGRVFWYNLPN